MTTNHDHEIKFKRLNNLKDPAANRTWLTNIINICRSRKVTELVRGTKEDRGMLVLLLQSRVFPDEDGVLPDGDETVSYGTGDDDWSAALTAEMETLLWGICYAALSDTMRETMSEKFDLELRGGGPPEGTALCRHVNAKITMLDPKAQDRTAKKEYMDHIATPMPEPLDTAGMDAWLDTAVALNARRTTSDEEHEIIEAAIQKFPADLVDKIEAKTEATKDAEEDLDIARSVWATVIERSGLRTKAREAERAMAAAAAAANGDARIAALEARLAAAELRATRAETAAVAAAAGLGGGRPRPSAGHPFHAKCGGYHPGGDAGCWMLNMNLVPSRMAHMYAGLHAKRANPPDGSAPLPDLTAQYPPLEAARVCVECGDPAAAVARAASAVGTDVRGTMLVDSQASVDLAYDEAMFEPGSLVPCVGKQVQVASGDLLSATHIGTLLLTVRDTSGAWRALRRPGAWLVPGLQMNLLSVRAGKLLGARAPDFDALRVYGTNGEVFPMLDVKPDYVLDSRVLADVLAEKAAAAIARGRNPIQYGTLSDGDAAGIISEIFGGAGADTIRGALGATDGIPDKCKEKILRGLAHLAPDLTSNMQSAPSPAADLKSRDKTGTVLSDLSGPHPVCEIGPFRGARYSISFLDAERDFAAVYFLKNKKPAGIIAALKKFLAECRALDPTYRIRVLRTDRGSEYLNSEMDDFAGAEGFVQSPGAAYHPDHTRSESLWRTINRFVRSGTRGDARATPLWPYFAKQAIELRNLYDRGGGVSAVELMSGVKPSLKAVRPIGCRAVVKKTDAEMRREGSTKFTARGHEGVYLGTERNGPAYMVWVPSIRRVKYSADVDFDLASFPLRGDTPTTTDFVTIDSPATPDSLVEMNFTGEICAGGEAADYNLGGRPDGGDEGGGDEGGGDEGGGDEGGGDEGGGDEGDDGEEGAGDERDGAGAGRTARPTRARRAPAEWWKSGPNALTASALSTRCADLVAGTGAVDALDVSDLAGADEGDAILLQLPGGHYTLAVRTESAFATKVVNTAEALSGPRAAEVRGAVDSEMGGHLERHETFTLIPITDKPVEAQLIDLKLIISEKTGALGEFLKDKARLVARGDQEWGGDPWKKFAPMLRYSTLRLMCALAAMLGRRLYTSDAVQAYLNATLSEPRYGRLPKELREHNSDGVELIAFIRKALYGLAEAGHAWNAEIHQYLTAPRAEGGMGFTRCSFEPCMYVRYDGDDWALLGLACDNAIHLESSDAVHAQVLGALQARFDWVDEGEVSEVPSVLGTKIVQDLEAGTVTLSQEGYVDSLAEEWAEHLSKRKISTPASKELEEKVVEAARTKGEARSPALVKRYQRLVGALLFKSVVTGPDIAWAVAMLSRAMAWPTEALMGEAFRCLSYVVQHKSLPIKFSRDTYFSARTGTTVFRRDADQGGLSGVFAIDDGHSDADYAAGPSVSGWAWRAAGAAFLYGSKRQSETMLCSASSELVAGSVAATDGLHARGLKDEMGFPESGPTRLWIDNKATVALAHDPTSFSKIKHVARRHHFLRECVESGALDVGHISTDFNIADLFTKALEPKKFRLFRAAVMNLPIETLRG